MKNNFKFFGIIVMVMIIGFSMTACDDGSDNGGGSSVNFSITLTDDAVRFSIIDPSAVPTVNITTNLPSPNDSFTLGGGSSNSRIITSGVSTGQTITGTGTVPSGRVRVATPSGVNSVQFY